MNKKERINVFELDKYFVNSILPLFLDVEDVPKKGKLLLVASVCFLIQSSHLFLSN